MSLSAKDTNLILYLINEDTCGSTLTFEQISIKFQHGTIKSDYLRLGNALVLLLQNPDLTPLPQQRLIIYFLLAEMYKNDQQPLYMNPFAPVFLSVLESNKEHLSKAQKHFHWVISSVTECERLFINLLISNNDNNSNNRDLLTKTPNELLNSDLLLNEDHRLYELPRTFKEKLLEKTQQIPALARCHLPALISDPEMNHFGLDAFLTESNNKQYNNNRKNMEDLLINNASRNTIHPDFLRLVPPLHECTTDELVWLCPPTDAGRDASLLAWDPLMCMLSPRNLEIRQLFDQAYKGAIHLAQQRKIMDELDNDPNLICHIGVTPSKLQLLVENNPALSVHCLWKLNSSNQKNEYLESLANLNISLYSLEVVNRLSTLIELPQGFLLVFISKCIKACNETKDIYAQSRIVRLVSVFIQSLVRNKAVDIKDHLVEVQNFCTSFRNIKEVTALLHLIETYNFQTTDINETANGINGNQ